MAMVIKIIFCLKKMFQLISKSQFKTQVLTYLREVEKKKQPLIVTHNGKPVIKISPYKKDLDSTLSSLRNTVVSYKNPTASVASKEWEAVK